MWWADLALYAQRATTVSQAGISHPTWRTMVLWGRNSPTVMLPASHSVCLYWNFIQKGLPSIGTFGTFSNLVGVFVYFLPLYNVYHGKVNVDICLLVLFSPFILFSWLKSFQFFWIVVVLVQFGRDRLLFKREMKIIYFNLHENLSNFDIMKFLLPLH